MNNLFEEKLNGFYGEFISKKVRFCMMSERVFKKL